jgi:hypothetical protein
MSGVQTFGPEDAQMSSHDLFRRWRAVRDQVNALADPDGPGSESLWASMTAIEAAIMARRCESAVDLAVRHLVGTDLGQVENHHAFDSICRELAGLTRKYIARCIFFDATSAVRDSASNDVI